MKIEWKLNLERTPWWGGIFERMVASVKSCLRKVIGNAKLTFDELHTVLETSRTPEYVLTPSHLIFGRRIRSLPDESTQQDDDKEGSTATRRRFRNSNKRLAYYWKRWKNEYLANLREK